MLALYREVVGVIDDYRVLIATSERGCNRKVHRFILALSLNLSCSHAGQMVGVLTLSSSAPGTRVLPLFSIDESRSSRSLLDVVASPAPSPASSDQSLYDTEISILNGRSIVVVTTLILLIATGLGVSLLSTYALLKMWLIFCCSSYVLRLPFVLEAY